MKYQGKCVIQRAAFGHKTDLKQAIKKEVKPNWNVMHFIGKMIVEGFQGGEYPTTISVDKRGFVRGAGSRDFPYGILRQKSPTGKAYKALAGMTIAYKQKEGVRDPDAALRFRPMSNPDALINQLQIRVYADKDGVEVKFKDPTMNELSKLHEEGRRVYKGHLEIPGSSEKFTRGHTDVPTITKIPSRPHRAIQPRVIEVVNRVLTKWMAAAKV